MPSLFVDTERLRNLNSGLGQVCHHLGHQLMAQRRARPDAGSWDLTYLVPRGRSGYFGAAAAYLEASWWRRFLIHDRFDVWHCLHQDSVYLPSRARLVLTIYDLNFMERADYSAAKKSRRLAALQRRIDRASCLTAGSEFTAAAVRRHLRVPDGTTLKVVHTGVAVRQQDAPANAPRFMAGSDLPFLCFVGVIHPRKNLHTLLPLLEAFPGHRLVLAGPDHHPYAGSLRALADQARVVERLVMPGPVEEAAKLWLYSHCDAFLFPSLSEGFGLPVVEAMAFGRPVFISRLTSLPEVGGADAYYFDDFAKASVVRVVRDGLADFRRDPGRAARLRARAARFSWEAVTADYWSLYEDLAAGRNPSPAD